MARVRFLPDELDVEALADETLLNASTRAGIPHTHACGGNARCSTCRVIVLEGVENCAPRTGAEHAIAAHLQFDVQVRLALVEDEMRRPGIKAVGEEKSLAILFAYIRGFTAFAENLLPYDVIHALNRYYDE